MTPGTAPGVAIFSAQWMDEVAPEIPEPERSLVREICETFQLGNSTDPHTLAGLLDKWTDAIRLSGYDEGLADAERDR